MMMMRFFPAVIMTMMTTTRIVRSFSPIVTSSMRRVSSTRLFDSEEAPQTLIPMTLLSGFLGSGKTCTLKHLLENTDGVKVGVIVNDVASVNIDAKLISSQQNGIVELANGCACCSLADELLTSVDSLLSKQGDLDALVVELSGVADPVAIKSNWKMAAQQNHPVTKKTSVDKVVTLIDASTFGSDWMTHDIAGERGGWTEQGDDCTGQRQVTELLAEQVESADVVLVNKVDMATPEEIQIAASVARGINDKAAMQEVSFGQISPKLVLGDLMPVVKEEETGHDHGHDHACAEPDCTDSSHSHSHDHAASDEACVDLDCIDTSHSHSHAHVDEADCSDPDCTDTTHSHTHSHKTSTDQLGITNFVYSRSQPFHAQRLLELLNKWPVPIKDDLDLELLQEAQYEGYSVDGVDEGPSPFTGVLRSKGFVWLAPNKWMGANDDAYRHETAMYWSHAGKHFGITSAGKWWSTVGKDQMKTYFTDMDEYNRIIKDDFVSEEWGDRRQEIVFIGVGIDEKIISDALDECLLLKGEMDRYRQDVGNYEQLMQNQQRSAGLFDVGGIDQIDEPNY